MTEARKYDGEAEGGGEVGGGGGGGYGRLALETTGLLTQDAVTGGTTLVDTDKGFNRLR